MKPTKQRELKIYYANESCTFRKTKELNGGLSNMASGFPIEINNIKILSSEALYQACRFPHLPEVQEKIISEKSPMTAKMLGKPHRGDSRPDWDETRIKIMRWCLRVKLAQNFIEFGKLLETTTNKPIVEDSTKDDFWGAIRDKDNENVLRGVNALGRLLMELRQFYYEKKFSYEMFVIEPLVIPDFKLYGQAIKCVDERQRFISFISKALKFEEIEKVKPIFQEYWEYKKVKDTPNILSEPIIPLSSIPKLSFGKIAKTKTKKAKGRLNKYAGQGQLPF